MNFRPILGFSLACLLGAGPAQAQLSVDVTDESGNDLTIAVPVLPTPQANRGSFNAPIGSGFSPIG